MIFNEYQIRLLKKKKLLQISFSGHIAKLK